MKLWIDDVRPAPDGYIWCKTVSAARYAILSEEDYARTFPRDNYGIEVLDMDHDAGDFASDSGDYIKLLDWLEETGRSYPIRIHSMNPVGVENMRRIIQKNGWTEVR